MNIMLTNDALQAIRARCEAVTPGPWHTECHLCREEYSIDAGSGEICSMKNYGCRVKPNALFIAHARADVPALLDHIEHLQRVYTIPCLYCDFSNGQRDMECCPHCDGTGRMATHAFIAQQRDAARAEAAERKAALEQAWYVLDSAAAGVAPKVAAVMARTHVEKCIGKRESIFDDATKEAASECRK